MGAVQAPRCSTAGRRTAAQGGDKVWLSSSPWPRPGHLPLESPHSHHLARGVGHRRDPLIGDGTATGGRPCDEASLLVAACNKGVVPSRMEHHRTAACQHATPSPNAAAVSVRPAKASQRNGRSRVGGECRRTTEEPCSKNVALTAVDNRCNRTRPVSRGVGVQWWCCKEQLTEREVE